MVFTTDMMNGLVDYSSSIREKEENYSRVIYDDIIVYWEKKNIFGKMVQHENIFSFKRYTTYENMTTHYHKVQSCDDFVSRLKNILSKNSTKSNSIVNSLNSLKIEFSGTDDFSLGVQHAISIFEKNLETS